ncbi:hypothetical protein EAH89_14660 [Roseomonas nepalensis]|uniref:Tyr recombinase domain-containing protein n=2 Tax=Muricoccus nepalensis TaxID=1854500 RepID=A0A502G132_9PROT|nr:hypothetical protein EAH89_14660 [Roseomonas nepalensis]
MTCFMAEIIKSQRAGGISHYFSMLSRMTGLPYFRSIDIPGEPIGMAFMSELIGSYPEHARYLARYARDWYEWCCDQGYPRFSAEVCFELREIRFGGNAKGAAVLSLDPDGGPLNDIETTALLNALRASRDDGRISLQQQVAIWLCTALGGNNQQYVLMRADDLLELEEPDSDGAFYQIRVARIKKRHARERHEFKTRKLTREIGSLVQELISQNRASLGAGVPAGVAMPVFMRPYLREARLGGAFHEYALSMSTDEFGSLVRTSVAQLGVVSPRTGKALQATCRRFRYTFATRLVREGASQREVAETLDHTDLQNVQCYFDLKSDIVEKLDEAMALTLGPISQAFLGHLVRTEALAVRGGEAGARIYRHDREAPALDPIGTCGSFSFCGLNAPVACYTCNKFQPWLDAPHQELLRDLLAERKRREEGGLDGRMVALTDTTILAVADVVSRVAATKSGDHNHVG